jgi:hypothetical protein
VNRGHLLSGLATVIAIPALGLGLTVTALEASASPATVRVVATDCPGQASAVRPSSYVFACADGNDYLAGLHWTSWAAGKATAAGQQEVNDCTPFCYDGHFHSYPVSVTFWGSAAVAGHPGEQRYTEVTLQYSGARPSLFQNGHKVESPKVVTWALPTPIR